MFKLHLNYSTLTGALGRDGRVYFQGQNAASLLGYKSRQYFARRYGTHVLRDVALVPERCDPRELDKFYIEYNQILAQCRNHIIMTRDWQLFQNLYSVRVIVRGGMNWPMLEAHQEGVIFWRWILNYYSIPVGPPPSPVYSLPPIYSAPRPASPPIHLPPPRPASPPIHSPPPRPASTPAATVYAPDPPPVYTPASPVYTPPQPPRPMYTPSNNSLPATSPSGTMYTPASPAYAPPPTQEEDPTKGFFLFMDNFPPKSIKFGYQGKLEIFEKK